MLSRRCYLLGLLSALLALIAQLNLTKSPYPECSRSNLTLSIAAKVTLSNYYLGPNPDNTFA
jgi:hypothetical protein